MKAKPPHRGAESISLLVLPGSYWSFECSGTRQRRQLHAMWGGVPEKKDSAADRILMSQTH